jgi:hypothetical protein
MVHYKYLAYHLNVNTGYLNQKSRWLISMSYIFESDSRSRIICFEFSSISTASQTGLKIIV